MISFRETQPNIPNLDKIGNLIIYLVDEIKKKHSQNLFLTKLLKLLYIIDETSVKETGAPVTGLDYRVWRMGPVAYDVYKDFMFDNSEKFSFFAEGKKRDNGDGVKIQSVNKFDDSEFSDYEIELANRIIDQYGNYDGEALISLLHEKGGLWERIVEEKHLNTVFESQPTTSHRIDLSELLAGDSYKRELFNNAKKSLNL